MNAPDNPIKNDKKCNSYHLRDKLSHLSDVILNRAAFLYVNFVASSFTRN